MLYCNDSKIDSYIANLTSSYVDKSNEASMVFSSIFILVLAGTFFNLNLLGRFSDLTAVQNRGVHRFLSVVLSMFLPVMSYIFSEAKNSDPEYQILNRPGMKPDLPLRAGLILVWMLLVELLRNNVEEIRMRGYETSGLIQRAGRVVWLGSLVFFNIRSAGRKAIFGGLWILCASKLVQRVGYTEFGKRSYVHNKNAKLIASYMSQVVVRRRDRREHPAATHAEDQVELEVVEPAANNRVQEVGVELLKRCEYIVMGEEELVKEATAHGYELLDKNAASSGDSDTTLVTVGKVWVVEPFTTSDGHERLRRLCLSFALFKLLRRRFEDRGEITEDEARDCRDLIFNGLICSSSSSSSNGGDGATLVFQVMNDEVNFLSEYYHSVVPVVLASPFFLLSNYLLLPLVLFGLWLMTIVICGNGDLTYAFRSITKDNNTVNFGIPTLASCLLTRVKDKTKRVEAFFSTVDISISFLLFLIFMYEEVWEFVVFVFSNWFVVSLLRKYIQKPEWRQSSVFVGAFRCILWVRSFVGHRRLRFKQFSALDLRRPLVLASPTIISLPVPVRTVWSVPVPAKGKHSIVDYLSSHVRSRDGAPARLSNGMSALEKHTDLSPFLSWACQSDSIAEVILTWHIATSLLQVKSPPPPLTSSKEAEDDLSAVARSISQYCTYLVVFHPELLPDNKDKTERVFEAMKEELRSILGYRHYYLWTQNARAEKILDSVKHQELEECCWKENQVVRNGATLANVLMENAGSKAMMWQLLADVWTELIVYVAPSSNEGQVKGHESLLVQGGEFLTMLWALTTHTGIYRPASQPATHQ